MRATMITVYSLVTRCSAYGIFVLLLSQSALLYADVSPGTLGQELIRTTIRTESCNPSADTGGLSEVVSSRIAVGKADAAALRQSGDAIAHALHASVHDESVGYQGDLSKSQTAGGSAKRPWTWRRASLAELAAITIAAAGTLYSDAEYSDPKHADWTAHNGFDDSLRDALRLRGGAARDVAGSVGDGLMLLLIAEPIVDSFYTLGYRDRNWDALWQTSVINLESFTFTALVSSVAQNTIKREKPFARDCPIGGCVDEQPNRSMPSGHVAFAFTGAGLYCTHHKYQSLYDPATERALCYTSLGLAAVDGLARIMADHHYATDVIAGSAIGLFSGFLLPRLLHYYRYESQQSSSNKTGPNSFFKHMSLTPQILSGGGTLNCNLHF